MTTAKYILRVHNDNGTTFSVFEERPTQDYIKTSYGEGEHTLFDGEGKVLRHFHVARNRNQNLAITAVPATGLESLSTLNLNRLIKYYERIIKIWPAKASDVKAVQKELAMREALLTAAQVIRQAVA